MPTKRLTHIRDCVTSNGLAFANDEDVDSALVSFFRRGARHWWR